MRGEWEGGGGRGGVGRGGVGGGTRSNVMECGKKLRFHNSPTNQRAVFIMPMFSFIGGSPSPPCPPFFPSSPFLIPSSFLLPLLVLDDRGDEGDDTLCDSLWAHGSQDEQLL